MLKNNEQIFLNGLQRLAERCNFILSDWEIEAFNFAFRDLGFEKGIEALKIAFFTIRGNQMPAPMDLLEMIGVNRIEAPKPRDAANDLAGKIIEAIGSIGGYNPGRAKEKLGDRAWDAIQAFGGWANLCMIEIDEQQTVRAQLRDILESRMKIQNFESRPMIESGNKSKQILEMVNALTAKK